MKGKRLPTTTVKVPTRFGALYAHLVMWDGKLIEVSISTPGKHWDTAVHEAMIALGEAITEALP